MAEWDRRLDDFASRGQRNVVDVQVLEVHQVGLVNRTDDEDDRVVVLMQATLLDYVESDGGRLMRTDDADGDEKAIVHEYWTLGKRDGVWCLQSIEGPKEGEHNLTSDLVATPAHDTRVRDEAVFEIAEADKVDDDRVADLLSVDYEGDARLQAQDAALVDGRFASDVLETAVRRAVDAWLGAVDGSDEELLAIADPAAVDVLLYGGDAGRTSRIVVRGARVGAVAITRCDVHARPAELEVHVDVSGVRYREDRDTLAVLEGDRSRARRWQETWTFTLSGAEGASPWRLARAGSGAAVSRRRASRRARPAHGASNATARRPRNCELDVVDVPEPGPGEVTRRDRGRRPELPGTSCCAPGATRAARRSPFVPGSEAAGVVRDPIIAATLHIAAVHRATRRCTDRAGLRARYSVLVTGAAGGVGSAAIGLARAAGARVVALATGAAKAATWSSRTSGPPATFDRVRRAAAGDPRRGRRSLCARGVVVPRLEPGRCRSSARPPRSTCSRGARRWGGSRWVSDGRRCLRANPVSSSRASSRSGWRNV